MSGQHRIIGSGSKNLIEPPLAYSVEKYKSLNFSHIQIDAVDQIVTVDAGVPIAALQEALAREGQCLPLPCCGEHGRLLAGFPGTVGGLVASNLPHGLTAQHGGPREWLLQAEVLFHGQKAVSGAKVVKSVAGYDVHKAYVGSRGLLGPILRVTLRTWPTRSVQTTVGEQVRVWNGEDVWILRSLPSMFEMALKQAHDLYAFDRLSCTLWAGARPQNPAEGWIVGPRGESWRDNLNPGLEQRLKQVFDPEGRWV